MNPSPHTLDRRPGFTLVELLTVVAIIALLISIVVPSVTRARDQARRGTVLALHDAITKNLEMYRNDFRNYPDSSFRVDPIDPASCPAPPPPFNTSDELSGAHWLARAMLGFDFQGTDAEALSMRTIPTGVPDVDYNEVRVTARRGTYMEGPRVWAADTDADRFNVATSPDTGRPLIVDTYEFPVLYYRANPRAQRAFSFDAKLDGSGDPAGVFNLRDNAEITGADPATSIPGTGWDFATTGALPHPIGTIDDDYQSNPGDIDAPDVKNGFVQFLHDHQVEAQTNGLVVQPVKRETFLLISPGRDGLYGTEDDLTNFRGL